MNNEVLITALKNMNEELERLNKNFIKGMVNVLLKGKVEAEPLQGVLFKVNAQIRANKETIKELKKARDKNG